MAENHYSNSPRDPHPPLLTAAGRTLPSEGIAARMASGLPPRHAGVIFNSITCN